MMSCEKKTMLTVGSAFPAFRKKAVVSLKPGKEFAELSSEDHKKDGKWMVLFWWPLDFTFVCPTEIVEFNKDYAEFQKRNTLLIGASTDSEFVHLAWRNQHAGLRELQFPMLADTSKSLSEELGILVDELKVPYRVTYIVDPKGVIRWLCMNDLSVGRNTREIIRVLDALQTGELTPCNWEKGQDTLKV